MQPDSGPVAQVLELLLDDAEHGVPVALDRLRAAVPVDEDDLRPAVAALVDAGAVREADDGLLLTAAGRERAVVVVRRHRLAERLLADVIGLDWWKVHHEAQRWEGVISAEVERHLVELLGDPGTCPHGNPIPGSANRPDQSAARRLAGAAPGPVRVVRITEDLEADDEALRLLEWCGFLPGRDAEVKGVGADGVEVAGAVRDARLPAHVAERTYVAPR